MKEMFGKDSVEKEISGRMNDLVRLEKNPFLRAVPLEIKNLFLLRGLPLAPQHYCCVFQYGTYPDGGYI